LRSGIAQAEDQPCLVRHCRPLLLYDSCAARLRLPAGRECRCGYARPPTSAGAGAPAGRVPVLGAETISVGRLTDDPPKSVFSLRSTQSIRCDEVGSLLFGGLFLARLLLGRGFLCRSFGGLF